VGYSSGWSCIRSGRDLIVQQNDQRQTQVSASPVTIIGGYLGSGKTTLVNHLLRNANGIRLAVMVNDFGELPIDADLIEAQDGEVISLSGGCICCSYGDDLSLSLQKLQVAAIKPDHILIEASGVALPGAIASTLTLSRSYQLEGIVVLADATSITEHAKHKYIADTIEQQLNDADLIILSKSDLLSENQTNCVHDWISELHPSTPLVSAAHGDIPTALLLQEQYKNSSVLQAQKGLASHDVSLYQSHSFCTSKPIDTEKLVKTLIDPQYGVIRAKGFVLDKDRTMKTVQIVGRRWSVTTAPPGIDSGMVCIGIRGDFDQAKIEEQVKSCKSHIC